jgi:ketosteroid isomerase-like protein
MTTNVDTTRSIYDAINAADADTVFAHFHDDIVVHEPPGLSYGGTYKGRASFDRLLVAEAEHWDGLQLVADDMLDADPCVIIRGRIIATIRSSGRAVEQPYLELLRFQDGKVIEAWVQMDTADVNSLVPLAVS